MNKKILCISIVICTVLSASIYLLSRGNEEYTAKKSDIVFSSNNVEFSNGDYVEVEAQSGFKFDLSKDTQTVDLGNHVSNVYLQEITLYLGDGTEVFRTGLLKPGEHLTNIVVNNVDSGCIYKGAILVFEFYKNDGSLKYINRCSFPVEIVCS